ncbi:MAG: type II toxin-antitoxin system VapC family toxin [Candidatus Sericytochromatia bacterium]
MSYLLDSHTVVWFLEGDPRLSDKAREIIEAAESELCVSAVSFWELGIKSSLGKLRLRSHPSEMMQKMVELEIRILQIEPAHVSGIVVLPFHHKDPFDRLLIATALAEEFSLISADHHFRLYQELKVVW